MKIQSLKRRFASSLRGFREDNRGLSSQVDFMVAVIIYVTAAVIALGASTALIYGSVGANPSNGIVADRAADRLADDFLVDNANDAILDRECTTAFFDKETPEGCGFESSWSSVDQPEHYLNRALAVEEAKQINVTIRTTSGSIETVDGTRLALGDEPPEDRSTVHGYHRQVGLDANDDGAAEWYRISVKIW
jgi:hypothetical protein